MLSRNVEVILSINCDHCCDNVKNLVIIITSDLYKKLIQKNIHIYRQQLKLNTEQLNLCTRKIC